MPDFPDIDVKRLRLLPGDIAVFSTARRLSPETRERLRAGALEFLEMNGHPGVRVLVLEEGTTLGVLAGAAPSRERIISGFNAATLRDFPLDPMVPDPARFSSVVASDPDGQQRIGYLVLHGRAGALRFEGDLPYLLVREDGWSK